MRKMFVGVAVAALAVSLMLPMAAFAQGQTPLADQGVNDQQPAYACSLKAGATPTITAEQAQAAALAANPGTTASSIQLDDENGCLVYGVQLSSGADVKVDAGSGQVVHTEAAGADDALEGARPEGVETESAG
jgi:uncharacterized membrane protein YkoI